jgi:hypothetical protein
MAQFPKIYSNTHIILISFISILKLIYEICISNSNNDDDDGLYIYVRKMCDICSQFCVITASSGQAYHCWSVTLKHTGKTESAIPNYRLESM